MFDSIFQGNEWEGEIRLGDVIQVMKNYMEDSSVDLIIVDPPYLIDYQSNQRTATMKFNKIIGDSYEDDAHLIEEFLEQAYRVMKSNTSIYMFCSWHNIAFFQESFTGHFFLKNLIVWDKNRHGMGDLTGAYAGQHELVLYGHKGRDKIRGYRYPDVLRVNKVAPGKLIHPNQKPEELLRIFIETSSNPGDIVFDGFGGSGSTARAARDLNRKYIIVEKDPDYYNLIVERLKERKLF